MNTLVSFELDKLLLSKNIDMPVNPTIADVVMWLYEKHGIWISSDFSEVDESFTYKIHLINSDNLPRIFTDCGYNSPTEAYEAAIIYTLNNLI